MASFPRNEAIVKHIQIVSKGLFWQFQVLFHKKEQERVVDTKTTWFCGVLIPKSEKQDLAPKVT